MLEPNTILQGRYRILSPLGKGGMGAVYLAKDENLGVTVAVKKNTLDDLRLIEAFKREARLLASLRHPALPQVRDHFLLEGIGQFLVMEYIAGADLGEVLDKRRQNLEPVGEPKPFEVDEVIRWAEQLLDALDYLHAREEPIIHRDIKPQNLKLAERNQIILLDFGLAKGRSLQMTRVTTTGSIYGYTPSYAPIEQIRGLGTDPRSDLYALGATLYHLLTGAPPVDAATRADAFLGGEPDPLLPASAWNAKVSQSFSAVLMKAMEQHRNHRVASARAMLEMVRAAKQAARREAAQVAQLPPTRETHLQEDSTIIIDEQRETEARQAAEQERLRQLAAEAEQRKQQEDQARRIREEAERRQQEARRRQAQEEAERRQQEERERKEQESERRRPSDFAPVADAPLAASAASESLRAPRRLNKIGLSVGAGLLLIAAIIAIWVIVNKRSAPPSVDSGTQASRVEPAGLNPGIFTTPGAVYKVSLSNDGRVLAAVSEGGRVRLWTPEGEKQLSDGAHKGRSVAVSPDGQLVASGSEDGTLRFWRTQDGQVLNTIEAHADYLFSIGFNPDGRTLFTASGDKKIKLWQVRDGALLKTIATPEEGYLIVTVSSDLRLAGFYHPDGSFKLWSIEQEDLLRMLDGEMPAVTCGAFSADGQLLALGSRDGEVQLWRVSDGRMIRSLGKFNDAVYSLAFTQDGKTVAAGFSDSRIRVWNVSNGVIRTWRAGDGTITTTLNGHTQSVDSLAFSAGSLLASGSEDKTIRLWDIVEK